MKLLHLTSFYKSYIQDFYAKHPGLASHSYAQQKAALDYDAFGWGDFWSQALKPLGYEVMGVIVNVKSLQEAWALENGLGNSPSMGLHEIVFRQIENFKPEILWYEHYDEHLLKKIRAEVPSIRIVLGWVGSAVPRTGIWQDLDLILSCAPESVAYLTEAGFRSICLSHAFEPKILGRLRKAEKTIDCSFIGQISRDQDFHLERERILEYLSSRMKFQIFSPSATFGFEDEIKVLARILIYEGMVFLRKLGISESTLKELSVISKATKWSSRPRRPVSPKLKQLLKPAVFGLEMFETLQASKVSLNVHADSSPTYASNMRLFETTGVGTCLVTEWRKNLFELFEPDKEVVTYRSPEECLEKIKWLLEHPEECQAIAKAGQARTLKDHTFIHRAGQLDRVIKSLLG
jgi:spore maturation protein CgeB